MRVDVIYYGPYPLVVAPPTGFVRTTRISRQAFPVSTSPLTTASFTPPNNSLLVVLAAFQKNAAGGFGGVACASAMTISDTAGLTWTSREFGGLTTDYGGSVRGWTAPVTTGVSMTVSVDCGAFDIFGGFISVVDYTGYNTADPVGATAIDISMVTNGADSITLSAAPAATSEIFGGRYGGVPGSGAAAATPGSGYVEIHDLSVNGASGLQTQARPPGSTSTTFEWADVSSGTEATLECVGIAIEIKAASAEAGPTDIVPFRQRLVFLN